MAFSRGQGSLVAESELQACRSDNSPRPHWTQLHLPQLAPYSDGPSIWDRNHARIDIMALARELHPSLGLETTDGRTWRIIAVTADMRRALDALDIREGDVIPDPVLIEQRRRAALARMQVAQARDVLRGVQLDYDIARERRALDEARDDESAVA